MADARTAVRPVWHLRVYCVWGVAYIRTQMCARAYVVAGGIMCTLARYNILYGWLRHRQSH